MRGKGGWPGKRERPIPGGGNGKGGRRMGGEEYCELPDPLSLMASSLEAFSLLAKGEEVYTGCK